MTTPSESRPTRKRLNRADREATLMQAAASIVGREGAEALTMEGLAAEVGVNKALVYRFFANRDAVLVALWHSETAAFDARIAETVDDEAPLEVQLRALLEVWLDEVEAGGGVLGRLDIPGVGPPELDELRSKRTEGVVYYLAELFRTHYDVGQRDALTAAAVLGSGAQGLAGVWAHTGWPRKKLTDTFVRLCIGAIEAVTN